MTNSENFSQSSINLENLSANPKEFSKNIELLKLELIKLDKAYQKFSKNKGNKRNNIDYIQYLKVLIENLFNV